MRITVYDGKDCIGGNKIYVQIDDKTGFFFDFGNNFSVSSKYFHDYLTERSVRGINTYIELDMIPKLNIYRADLIPADLDVSSFKNIPAQAVLLSHAHADHAGMIGVLREDIGVVASQITLALLKAFKDEGQTYLGSDFTYFKQRESEDGYVLESPRNGAPSWRPLYPADGESDTFHEFMSTSPYSPRTEFPAPDIRPLEDLPFDIKAVPVDHSVPGAVGFIVEADETVAYTGDLRLHGTRSEDTERFIKEAKRAGTSVLITEGTRVTREDDHYVSEEDVRDAIDAEFSERDGPIFVNFNGNDLDRLRTIADIAKKNGRTLLITEKLFYKLLAAQSAGYDCPIDDVKVLIPFSTEKMLKQWQKNLRAWFEDRIVTIPEIWNRLEEYAIYLNYYNVKDLADIRPKGGTYIHSASEAFEEEQEFDFVRLSNWLKHYNIEIAGFEMKFDRMLGRERPFFVGNYHASGHLSAEELEKMIDTIDPDVLIPVHTLNRAWFYERWDGRVRG